MQPRLSKQAVAGIHQRVDDMVDRLLDRLAGGSYTGKLMTFQVDPVLSIPGLHARAVSEEGGYLDSDLVRAHMDVVRSFIDKQRADLKATTVRRVQMLLDDVKAGRIEPAHFGNHVEGELLDAWARITSQVERVVDTETQHAVTLGLKDGIEQAATARGIQDPVFGWVVKNDQALCPECRRVHLMPDGHTPRLWLGSEVSSDYHARGEDRPSHQLMHPHCRCSPFTVLPGFGFDAAGRVTFVRAEWDELRYQRALGDVLGGVAERRAWQG